MGIRVRFLIVSAVVALLVAAIVGCTMFFTQQVSIEIARLASSGAPVDAVAATMRTLQVAVIVGGVLAIVASLLMPYLLTRRVADRIESLEHASRALAAGDTDYRVDASGDDELADLACAFVAMRETLDSTLERLREEVDRGLAKEAELEEAILAQESMNVELEESASVREQMDAELGRANVRLKKRLVEVASVTEDMSMLAEMGSMLQSDVASPEAHAIVARYAAALLPGTSGALYVMAASRNMLDRVSAWGIDPPASGFFSPTDCWSLRLGRTFMPDQEHVQMDCRHTEGDMTGASACVPLTAHGDLMGVLVFYNLVMECSLDGEDTAAVRRRGLAVTLAEHVALALSNLALRESLREQSIKDPLTGLYNRRYMEETIEREVARSRRTETPLSFVMLDVDHFKDYNDRVGHAAGDAVLAALGAYLASATRAEDVVCRYGGEEFMIAMPGADADSCALRADDLRRGVKGLALMMDGHGIPGVTISMGVAQLEDGATSAVSTLAAADRALYVAKNGGRDRVRKAEEADGVAEDAQGTTGYIDPAQAELDASPGTVSATGAGRGA